MCFGHVGRGQKAGKKIKPFPPKSEIKDFILAKARRFYLANGYPLGVKGLKAMSLNPFPPMSDFIDFTYQREALSC